MIISPFHKRLPLLSYKIGTRDFFSAMRYIIATTANVTYACLGLLAGAASFDVLLRHNVHRTTCVQLRHTYQPVFALGPHELDRKYKEEGISKRFEVNGL